VTATIDDDRPLIQAAQADPARFVELYDRYVDRVYTFVSSRTADRAAAEDITSEVFQQALAHLGGFELAGRSVRRVAVSDCLECAGGSLAAGCARIAGFAGRGPGHS
jgi:Sigma-70 region 2